MLPRLAGEAAPEPAPSSGLSYTPLVEPRTKRAPEPPPSSRLCARLLYVLCSASVNSIRRPAC